MLSFIFLLDSSGLNESVYCVQVVKNVDIFLFCEEKKNTPNQYERNPWLAKQNEHTKKKHFLLHCEWKKKKKTNIVIKLQ